MQKGFIWERRNETIVDFPAHYAKRMKRLPKANCNYTLQIPAYYEKVGSTLLLSGGQN